MITLSAAHLNFEDPGIAVVSIPETWYSGNVESTNAPAQRHVLGNLVPGSGASTLGQMPAARSSISGAAAHAEHLVEFLTLVYGAFDFGHVHLSGTGNFPEQAALTDYDLVALAVCVDPIVTHPHTNLNLEDPNVGIDDTIAAPPQSRPPSAPHTRLSSDVETVATPFQLHALGDLMPGSGLIALGETPTTSATVLGTTKKAEYLVELLAVVGRAFDLGHVTVAFVRHVP